MKKTKAGKKRRPNPLKTPRAPPAPRVAIYARVSTKDKQDTENQLRELRQLAKQRGWTLHGEYIDHASGDRGRSRRPEFARLFEDARAGRFDILAFWSLDRLSREGTLETLTYLQELAGAGVRWVSLTEQFFDTTGPLRDAIIAIFATLAKMERNKISERVRAGMARASAAGVTFGRPRKIVDWDKARRLFAEKPRQSVAAIAHQLGVSRAQVHRMRQIAIIGPTDHKEPLRPTKKRKTKP